MDLKMFKLSLFYGYFVDVSQTRYSYTAVQLYDFCTFYLRHSRTKITLIVQQGSKSSYQSVI